MLAMPNTANLPHALERNILIRASRDTVFRYFTDSQRWANWWGTGSTIDPRPGGKVYIRHPNAVEASGDVVSVDPPNQIVFTYGFASGQPMAPGSSLVTISLAEEPRGTRLTLVHACAESKARDEHVQGWRFQLSLFANVIANELHANAAAAIDDWYRAWADPDDKSRTAAFARIAIPEVEFHDRYSALSGLEDLTSHAGAAQRFMPGVRLEGRGAPRHCQGSVLSDWTMLMNGQEAGRGTNLFVFGPSGKIEWVTGFASA
jgi:uncharacterized protein YndB with AHSA1/START domain